MFDDNLDERFALAMERIEEIKDDAGIGDENLCRFFSDVATFIIQMKNVQADAASGTMKNWSFEKLAERNQELYADVAGEAYETSFANPAYAVRMLGEEYGKILSFLYMEIRDL